MLLYCIYLNNMLDLFTNLPLNEVYTKVKFQALSYSVICEEPSLMGFMQRQMRFNPKQDSLLEVTI